MFTNIHKLYLLRFLHSVEFFGAVSVPFFLDWAKLDYTRVFILQAWFTLWVVLLEVPTGSFADKYGRKNVILLSTVFWTSSMLIYGLFNSYYAFFIAEFIGAAGIALLSGADQALLYDSLIEQKKEKEGKVYLSHYDAAGTLGIVLGFPLGSVIAGSSLLPYPQTLPLTFLLTACLSALTFFVALTLHEPKKTAKTGRKENVIAMGISGFRHLLRHKTLRAFVINSTLISAATFFMFWFYQPLAGEAGIPLAYYGLIGAGFNLFGSLLLLHVKKLENLFGIKRIIIYSALIPALLFLGVTIIKNPFFVVFSIFMIAGLRALRIPLLADFMNRHIESKKRATVLSGVSMIQRAVIFVLYPIVGALADVSLKYTFLFLGGIVLLFTFITRIEAKHLK